MEYGHDHPTRHILVVDDELSILHAVERELKGRRLGRYAFTVAGFTDPRQALVAAERQTFDAVISDFRMPGMDGLEFLKALAAIQPDCPRLVLSGQTDMDSLVRMVNETHIYRFIAKPWDDAQLLLALHAAPEAVDGQQRRVLRAVDVHGCETLCGDRVNTQRTQGDCHGHVQLEQVRAEQVEELQLPVRIEDGAVAV